MKFPTKAYYQLSSREVLLMAHTSQAQRARRYLDRSLDHTFRGRKDRAAEYKALARQEAKSARETYERALRLA